MHNCKHLQGEGNPPQADHLILVCICRVSVAVASPLRVAIFPNQGGLHLLDVRGKLGEGLGVGQDGPSWVAQEADIPYGGETQLHWNVLLEGSVPEVLVHVPRTCKQACNVTKPLP